MSLARVHLDFQFRKLIFFAALCGALLLSSSCGTPVPPEPQVSPAVLEQRRLANELRGLTGDQQIAAFLLSDRNQDFLLGNRDLGHGFVLEALKRMENTGQIEQVLKVPAYAKIAGKACNKLAESPLLTAIFLNRIEDSAIARKFYRPCFRYSLDTIGDPEVLYQFIFKHQDIPRNQIYQVILSIQDPAYIKKIINNHPEEEKVNVAISHLEEINKNIRINELRRYKSEELLFKTVISEKDKDIQKAAIEKISDNNLLYKLVLEAELSDHLQGLAINKISDLQLLAKLTSRRFERKISESILDRLTDPQLMFEVAQNGSTQTYKYSTGIAEHDGGIRAAAARRLADPMQQRHVYENDPNSSVRSAAIENCNDQVLLAKAARNGKDIWERMLATAQLLDTDLLSNLSSLKDNQGAIAALRLALIEAALPNPPGKIALSTEWKFKAYRTGYVGTQARADTLKIDLLNATGGPVARAVFAPKFPRTIRAKKKRYSMNYESPPPIKATIQREKLITPLAEYLMKTTPVSVRNSFIMKNRTRLLRAAAIRIIAEQNTVVEAVEDSDPWVRSGAVDRLSDQETLKLIAKNNADNKVRIKAIGKVLDAEFLNSMLSDAEAPEEILSATRRRLRQLKRFE